MGIYIKSMKMPSCCINCFAHKCLAINLETLQAEYGCYISKKIYDSQANVAIRPNDCPLTEVPTPHGRLIDADELLNRKDLGIYDLSELKEILSYTPTIIETEGEL